MISNLTSIIEITMTVDKYPEMITTVTAYSRISFSKYRSDWIKMGQIPKINLLLVDI